ncbi:MAG: SRPBCC family protein [Candidatus Dormiibacterota bacterium]
MTSTTSTTAITQVYSVYIKATPHAIWDAITKPEWTEKYGYGGKAEFDLRPGGAYRGLTSAAMRQAGAPEVGVDGEVLESDPPRKLVQTFRMVMDERMATQGFTRLTYEISEGKGGVSKLTVTHELGDATMLAVLMSGGMADQGAGGGWNWVLSSLKTLLETGSPIDSDPANMG